MTVQQVLGMLFDCGGESDIEEDLDFPLPYLKRILVMNLKISLS